MQVSGQLHALPPCRAARSLDTILTKLQRALGCSAQKKQNGNRISPSQHSGSIWRRNLIRIKCTVHKIFCREGNGYNFCCYCLGNVFYRSPGGCCTAMLTGSISLYKYNHQKQRYKFSDSRTPAASFLFQKRKRKLSNSLQRRAQFCIP
jgi:hypothetical protein